MNISQSLVRDDTVESLFQEPDLLTFCKATADRLRLNILAVLENESFSVLELCDILELKQSALSHHLKRLSDAGLLLRRREGNSIFYSRSHRQTDPLASLQEVLFDSLNDYPLPETALVRRSQIQANRAEKSLEFFKENAEQFSRQQELVAPVTAYMSQLLGHLDEFIFNRGFHYCNDYAVLEIGPGEGELLPELSRRFRDLTALDNSREMLSVAQENCQAHATNAVRFIHGDTSSSMLANDSFDVIIMNMVLHHNASPAKLLADCRGLLRTNGVLFLSELSAHQQDWVRETCGDIWLGFEPEDLNQIAGKVGLKESAASFLAQRNGFVVQLRQFIRI